MAAIADQLKKDLARAMRNKDEEAKSTVRMMIAALKNEAVAGDSARDLTDADELAVLTREQRKRRESASVYAEAGRDDLASKESAEADFIARYLPQPLDDAELQQLVDAEMAALVASGEEPSMKHMGRVVKAVNAAAQGRADGGRVAALVKARLGS